MGKAVSAWLALVCWKVFATDSDIAAVVSAKMNDAISHPNTQYSLSLEDVWRFLKFIIMETHWLSVLHLMGRLTIILIMFYMATRLVDKIVQSFRPHLSKSRFIHSKSAVMNTILPITRSVLRWLMGFITLLLLLSELGVNIMPFVYSLSVIGLAVGIGSQNLVKDFINGVMTLVEGSMAVGEEVIIGQYKGVVESISLRYVHIRHETGALHTIPFSEVGTITNVSRDYAHVTISIMCDPSVSLQALRQIFEQVQQQLSTEETWEKAFIKPIDFQGIKRVSVQGVEIVAQMRTQFANAKPLTHAFYNRLIPLCHESQIPLIYGVSEDTPSGNPYTLR